MTRRQQELLSYVSTYAAAHNGVSPSYEEMMRHLGLNSKSGVHRLVVALEKQGKIVRHPSCARTIEVMPEGGFRPVVSLRLFTEVKAMCALSARDATPFPDAAIWNRLVRAV